MSVIYDQQGKRLDHLQNQATFIWETPHSMSVWTIQHKLGKFPSVTCVESTGNVIFGNIRYLNEDVVEIEFLTAITGKVFLN